MAAKIESLESAVVEAFKSAVGDLKKTLDAAKNDPAANHSTLGELGRAISEARQVALTHLKNYLEDHKQDFQAKIKKNSNGSLNIPVSAEFRRTAYAIRALFHGEMAADVADVYGNCCCGTNCYEEWQSRCPCTFQ